jgi:cysteine desulfurase
MKLPIYLDNHSTTQLDPKALDAMMPYLTTEFGNPSSKSHAFGWKAEFAIEKAREQVAKILGATAREIVFTSGSTESNNLALWGVAQNFPGGHLITTEYEHKCVRETAKLIATRGWSATFLSVDQYGCVNPADVQAAIRPNTFMASIMMANNEVGSINPIAEISKITRARGVLFHTDAAQAVGKIPIDVDAMGIDLLSLSAHKFYGPKGIGALYVRRKNPRVELKPVYLGGGQENGLRSGTHNVPGIVGLGAACEIALPKIASEKDRLTQLRDYLFTQLQAQLGDIELNGHPVERLPGSLNLSFPYIESDSLVASLNDIAVSSTSACMTAGAEPSYVLRAMGLARDRIHSSIRIGLGRFTTQEEIDYTIKVIVEKVTKLRAASPLYQITKEQSKKK